MLMKPMTKKILAVAVLMAVCGAVCLAQGNTGQAIDIGTSTLKNNATKIIGLVKLIVLIVGAALLGWAFFKKAKGDQGGNDALMNWGITLVGSLVAFEIIEALIKAIV